MDERRSRGACACFRRKGFVPPPCCTVVLCGRLTQEAPTLASVVPPPPPQPTFLAFPGLPFPPSTGGHHAHPRRVPRHAVPHERHHLRVGLPCRAAPPPSGPCSAEPRVRGFRAEGLAGSRSAGRLRCRSCPAGRRCTVGSCCQPLRCGIACCVTGARPTGPCGGLPRGCSLVVTVFRW